MILYVLLEELEATICSAVAITKTYLFLTSDVMVDNTSNLEVPSTGNQVSHRRNVGKQRYSFPVMTPHCRQQTHFDTL